LKAQYPLFYSKQTTKNYKNQHCDVRKTNSTENPHYTVETPADWYRLPEIWKALKAL